MRLWGNIILTAAVVSQLALSALSGAVVICTHADTHASIEWIDEHCAAHNHAESQRADGVVIHGDGCKDTALGETLGRCESFRSTQLLAALFQLPPLIAQPAIEKNSSVTAVASFPYRHVLRASLSSVVLIV